MVLNSQQIQPPVYKIGLFSRIFIKTPDDQMLILKLQLIFRDFKLDILNKFQFVIIWGFGVVKISGNFLVDRSDQISKVFDLEICLILILVAPS